MRVKRIYRSSPKLAQTAQPTACLPASTGYAVRVLDCRKLRQQELAAAAGAAASVMTTTICAEAHE